MSGEKMTKAFGEIATVMACAWVSLVAVAVMDAVRPLASPGAVWFGTMGALWFLTAGRARLAALQGADRNG